ncbi:AmmeMemoRadiSam system radical SAM enzyme [Elusimicrobiota bacterium]
MKKAQWWTQKNNDVQCQLCPHYCIIKDGKTGICRSRKNLSGELYSLTFNKFTSINIDPIEKKPLFHYFPGRKVFSVGTTGCNFRCPFCQNWEISQADPNSVPTVELTPEKALEVSKSNNSIGIAYTYNEPLINYEWIKETSFLIRKNGLKNVIVSNGYINREPLEEIMPFIDAVNVDIKFFKEKSYKKLCGADLSKVLETVETLVKNKKHVEITNLIITAENDSEKEIKALVEWVASLSLDIPLHFSKYCPAYKMKNLETTLDTLVNAYNIAKKSLKNVYIGNIAESDYSRTFCSNCGEVLIERIGYDVRLTGLKGGSCRKCAKKSSIIGF